jgi:hypothetical protein
VAGVPYAGILGGATLRAQFPSVHPLSIPCQDELLELGEKAEANYEGPAQPAAAEGGDGAKKQQV